MEQSNERIDFKYIFDGILKVLNFERGLPYTTRELLLRPGKMMKAYFGGVRKKYTHPIQFSILYVGLWALFVSTFSDKKALTVSFIEDFKDGINSDEEAKAESAVALEVWMERGFDYFAQYQNVFNLALIPILSVLTYFFYRKFRLYYPEHFVLNTYIIGMISFIALLFVPFVFIDFAFAMLIGGIFSFIYTIWVYMDVFDQKSAKGFFRSLGLNVIFYFIIIIFIIATSYSYMSYFFVETEGFQ
ncbi:MAG: DUF3667 domain-containing protein [Bacteroidota bacterium]